MKRFQFRLERVLRLRRMLDRQARQALAVAVAERVSAETIRDDMRAVKRQRISGMVLFQDRGLIDPRIVLLHETDIEALGHGIENACRTVETAETLEETRADELAEAHREVEVVAKLRLDALEEHRIETQKTELADLDEHVTRRHVVAASREIE